MSKSPAFQFYPQDYLSSARVAEMTLEEEGAYIRLLCYCWTTGSIPVDAARCARLVGKGCSIDTVTNVQRAFNVCSTNVQRMTHDRIEIEREKQALRRSQTSEAGKKSAESRAVSRVKPKLSNKRSTNVQRDGNPSSSPSGEDVIDSDNHKIDQFAEFWSVYPNKVAKGLARRAWKKAIQTVEPKKIIQAAELFKQDSSGKDPTYIKHPATWLNAESWEDALPQKQSRIIRDREERERYFLEHMHE